MQSAAQRPSMRYVALTRAGTIAPIVTLLRGLGVPVERLLATAGLPSRVVAERESLIPAAATVRLLEAASRYVDVPHLGFTAGERTDVAAVGVFGRLTSCAPTLGAALECAVRHHGMLRSSGTLWLRSREDRVELCGTVGPGVDGGALGWHRADQLLLGMMVAIVRLAAGPSWKPVEVHLQTAELTALRDAETLAAARVAFRQPATMLAVPRELLAAPLPPTRSTATPMEVEAWIASAPARDFAGSIRQAIATLSGGDRYPSVGETATFVGMSVRTLQRRLAEARRSHELLVAETRFAAAADVLVQTRSRILDLALDLGYSDHAAFTRAFRRWAGCSPRDYRRRSRERPPGPLLRATTFASAAP